MLETEIMHDIQKNYLVVHGEKEPDYMLKMLEGNRIQGFLNLEVRVLDNKQEYYYDVTGKETLLQWTKRKKLDATEIRKMVADILTGIGKTTEYLLVPEHFVLEPEYIYVDKETKNVSLCYTCKYEKNLNHQLTELFAFFMNVVDYEDLEAVDLVYGLYDVSREEHCTLTSLWNVFSVPKVKKVVIEEEPLEQEKNETIRRKNRLSGLKGNKRKEEKAGEKKKSELTREKKNLLGKLEKRKEKNNEKNNENCSSNIGCSSKLRECERDNAEHGEYKKQKTTQSSEKHINYKGYEKSKKHFNFKSHEISENQKNYISHKNYQSHENYKNHENKKEHKKQKNQEKYENNKKQESVMKGKDIIKIILIQIIMLFIFYISKKSGWIMDGGSISYTKLGLMVLILGGLDIYGMTEIVEKNSFHNKSIENNENEKEQLQQKNGKKIVSFQSIKQPEKEQQEKEQQENKQPKNGQEPKEIYVTQQGTEGMDFEKTVMLQSEAKMQKSKAVCYLVPQEKEDNLILLGKFPFFIGRVQKDTGILKEFVNISRMHSKIEQIGEDFYISDLNSTNGTYVNRKRVEQNSKIQLFEGDEVMFANIPYHFTKKLTLQ